MLCRVQFNISLAEASRFVHGGVICLLTALRFHGLTTQNPFEVWMAIEAKAWRPQRAVLPLLSDWTADPVPGVEPGDPPGALKYYGCCSSASTALTAELQIVSSLIGSYWEVEHSALY